MEGVPDKLHLISIERTKTMEVDASVDFSRIDDTVKVMLAQTMRARPRACPRQEDKSTWSKSKEI